MEVTQSRAWHKRTVVLAVEDTDESLDVVGGSLEHVQRGLATQRQK